jgi:hypothetical protein
MYSLFMLGLLLSACNQHVEKEEAYQHAAIAL